MISDLDYNYFQEHKSELTIVTEYESGGLSYLYLDTPFQKAKDLAAYLYLIIPALVTIILSSRFIMKEKKYLLSLIIPLSFILITFTVQSKNILTAIGWEKPVYAMLTATYVIVVLLISAIINVLLGIKIFSKNK